MENKNKGFGRIFLGVAALAAFTGALIAAGKVIFGRTSTSDDKNKERESETNLLVALTVLLLGVGALVTSALVLLRFVRKARGGYIIDLFDRDEYDVISPEEEDNFELLIRGELRPSDDDDYAAPSLHDETIPVDDEETEDDYK